LLIFTILFKAISGRCSAIVGLSLCVYSLPVLCNALSIHYTYQVIILHYKALKKKRTLGTLLQIHIFLHTKENIKIKFDILTTNLHTATLDIWTSRHEYDCLHTKRTDR